MADNNVPGDIDLLRPWFNMVRRFRKASIEMGGRNSIMTVQIILNEKGELVNWSVPGVARLEPGVSTDRRPGTC